MKNRQRGVAALAVVLLLLATMALVALAANRALLVEQRSSANQARATRAFELAEAGVEWATALLNDPRPVDAACAPAAAGASLRDKVLGDGAAFAPLASVRPACRIAQGALACSCPEPGNDPALPAGDAPAFGVAFAAVAGDTAAVQLTAWGCSGQAARCVPGAARPDADATAKVTAVLKRRPLLRVLPVAAVTAGGAVQLGAARVANLDRASHGALAVAGSGIDPTGATLQTLAGSPPANALYAADATLARLLAQQPDGSALFNAFFGMTPDRYRGAPGVRTIAEATAAERGAALRAAHGAGTSAFFVDGDVEFDAAGLGSAERPVLVVARGRVTCSAPCTIHGLLYADLAQRDAGDLANVELRGAAISRGAHAQATGSAITYDAAVLRALRARASTLVRVAGSWRDF